MSRDNGDRVDDYPILSRPFESMKPEYDVVVVGSGYGAGVAVSRMARAGKSVAVLELGWERRPGSFHHTLTQCLRDTHISGTSAKNSTLLKWFPSGNATRLFQLVLGDGQHAFLAHGLGGCSLINAGVFLEADKQTLQMSPWPAEIRKDPSSLQKYYTRAAAVLQPRTYPERHAPLKKMEHLQEQSRLLGQQESYYKVPLTTFFHNGRNSAGVRMRPNQGTGHETTGLNDGSKNSVATTYLADAWNWGAEIFCGCEVRYVEPQPDGKGHVIYFARHGSGREEFREEFKHQLFWVKAKEFCFLGAGALGTTEVLLRSKKHGLRMSPLVGKNMSGNGDMLIFGYNGKADVNGLAGNGSHIGPTVTSVIDNRLSPKSRNPLAGYIIEDGCIPEPFSLVIEWMFILQSITNHTPLIFWGPRSQVQKFLAIVRSLVLGPYAHGGSIQRSATYLVMSHDSNEITLTLKNDRPLLRGPSEGRSEHFKTMKITLEKMLSHSRAMMGYSWFYGRDQEEVSAHLLGGANMSRDGTGREGVTNHLGEVYHGQGTEVNQGLVCCDASVIPTALSVNPLATITAVAERNVALLAKKYHFPVDLETVNGNLDIGNTPRVTRHHRHQSNDAQIIKEKSESISWQFTEVLNGHISVGLDIEDFGVSECRGKGASSAMCAYLTIDIRRKPKGTPEPCYEGICTGTVSCTALSRTALKVTSGKVDFFARHDADADSTVMSYDLELLSVEGTRFNMQGHKCIGSRIAFSILETWKATTTVNVSISRVNGLHIGRGALHITWPSFRSQVKTFRTTSEVSLAVSWSLLAFFAHFIYYVSIFFLRPLGPNRFPEVSQAIPLEYKHRPSRICKIRTKDNVQVMLEIFEPLPLPEKDISDLPPVLCLPGVTGFGAAHHLFALPYLRCNMVDYFTARGHRCYALTPRWGCDLKVAQESIVFDCRLDVAAAVEYVQNRELRKPYVIAHCQGSVAMAMALLDGTIASSQILGITANSVFMNEVFAYWNAVKGRTTVLIQLYEYLAGNFFPMISSSNDTIFQRALDFLLRFYPVRRRRDICTSTACRRTSFGFGLLWNHDNLNRETHDNIHKFFAGTHTKLLKHVVRMGTRGACLDNRLRPLMTSKNLERLRGVPILFISGTENEVFDPETTLRDYELLRRRFGEENYRRFLAEGYGHLDPIVGKNAAEDVYWRVYKHLEECSERADVGKVAL